MEADESLKSSIFCCLSLLPLPSRVKQQYCVRQHGWRRGTLPANDYCAGGCKPFLSPSDKQAVKRAASLPPTDLKERLWISKQRSAFVLLLLLLFWPVNIPSSVN